MARTQLLTEALGHEPRLHLSGGGLVVQRSRRVCRAWGGAVGGASLLRQPLQELIVHDQDWERTKLQLRSRHLSPCSTADSIVQSTVGRRIDIYLSFLPSLHDRHYLNTFLLLLFGKKQRSQDALPRSASSPGSVDDRTMLWGLAGQAGGGLVPAGLDAV